MHGNGRLKHRHHPKRKQAYVRKQPEAKKGVDYKEIGDNFNQFYSCLQTVTILDIHVSRIGLLSLYFQVMLRRLSNAFSKDYRQNKGM